MSTFIYKFSRLSSGEENDDEESKADLKRMAREADQAGYGKDSGSDDSDYSWITEANPDEAYYLERIGTIYGNEDSDDDRIEDTALREMPEIEAANVIQHEAVAFLSYTKSRPFRSSKGSGKSSGKGFKGGFGPRVSLKQRKGSGKGNVGKFKFGFKKKVMSLDDR
mgnify:CR=1 FL=1